MTRKRYYVKKKRRLKEIYGKDNDTSNILRPNGFDEYSEEMLKKRG